MRRRDVLAGAAAFLASPVPGRADEVGAVAIARQPSLGHPPLMLVEVQGLVLDAAAARRNSQPASQNAAAGMP